MKDLINKNEKELQSLLKEKKEAVRAFGFAAAGGKVKNSKEGRNLRKEIARIMTLLNRPISK